MKFFFLFILLTSCVTHNISDDVKNEIIKFDKELTFDKFNELLTKYAERTFYPDIDR